MDVVSFTFLVLQKEIEQSRLWLGREHEESTYKRDQQSRLWLGREHEESTYKRDLAKRVELINWVLENMKIPNIRICNLIESRMNEIILKINKTDSLLEADPFR